MCGWQVINKSVTGVMILMKLVNGGSLGDCLHEGHWLVWNIANTAFPCTNIGSMFTSHSSYVSSSGEECDHDHLWIRRWCWGQTWSFWGNPKGFPEPHMYFSTKKRYPALGPFYWRSTILWRSPSLIQRADRNRYDVTMLESPMLGQGIPWRIVAIVDCLSVNQIKYYWSTNTFAWLHFHRSLMMVRFVPSSRWIHMFVLVWCWIGIWFNPVFVGWNPYAWLFLYAGRLKEPLKHWG